MTAVALRSRFFDHEEGLWGNLLRVLSTAIISSLVACIGFAQDAITANLGAERTTEDNHVGIAAIFGVGTRLTDELAVMGEIASQDLNQADERRILLNFGFRLKISAKHAIVGSVGHDILDGADGQKHFYATLAYQLFLQRKER